MKKALAVVMSVLAICMFVFVGCGNSSSTANNSLENTTWSLNGAESSGVQVTKDQLDSIMGETTLQFKEDGQMSMSLAGESVDGTYTVNGNTISLTMSGSTTDVTLDGDQITMESAGMQLFFTKQ